MAISRELKRGVAFTLKKKDYDGVLAKIKTANSVLHDLAGQNSTLELNRRHRSQARLIRLIRGLARSIFDALLFSLSPCSCARSHDVCLELEPRAAILVPTDLDEEVAKSFTFHVAMSSHSEVPTPKPNATATSVRWESMHIKPTDFEKPKSQTTVPSKVTLMTKPSKAPRHVAWVSKAKSLSDKLIGTQPSATTSVSQTSSSVSASSTQTLVETTQTLSVAPTLVPGSCGSQKISHLCRTLFR